MINRVVLQTPKQLPAALKVFQNRLAREMRVAAVKTAEFGVTAVQRTIRQTVPRPMASNTYMQSWAWKRTQRGAVLGTNVRHAIFVEIGRKAGKMPPVSAILEWVKLRRLVKPAKPKGRGKGTKKAAAESLAAMQLALAWKVARKIKNKGTAARFVLKRTMPKLQKYYIAESKKAISRAIKGASAAP
jgi:hypothetical protein